jgi:sulfite exporter TauE/SafE
MCAMGLYLAGWWRGLAHVEKLGARWWRRIEPMGRRLLPVRRPRQALLVGALWGWLPCGLVYSVLIWSIATGSATQGALLMLSFGLGTLPNLLLMGLFANRVARTLRAPLVRGLAGSMVIGFGVYTLYVSFNALR